MVSATEVSGDMHGAHLSRAIREILPDTHFVGIGGEKMRQAGVQVRVSATHMGTIGLVEGLKYYPAFLNIKLKAERILKREAPDILVLIDSRDFNLNLITPARKAKVPVVYYFAPPVWAWADWKMKRCARKIDRIISIFPFEQKIYQKVGADVVWVGHPLLDMAKPRLSKQEACGKFGLNSHRPVVSLLPGSREYEINTLLPVMLGAAEKLSQIRGKIQFLVPVASSDFGDRIKKMIKKCTADVKAVTDNIYDVMNISDLLVTASGTATLEAACIGTPMIIMYRTHPVTYILGKILVKLPWVGLPNILAEKKIVPELLQFRANQDNVVRLVSDFLAHPQKLHNMRAELGEVVKKLGSPGATRRAAQAVLEVATKNQKGKIN